MPANNNPQLEMVIGMLDKGRSHEQIRDAMGMTEDELDELLVSDAFNAWVRADTPTDAAITPEQALAWADAMTGPAMQALERVLTDPKTPAASRLRASEQILSWRQELASRKAEGDRRVVYNLLIENETLKRMQGFLDIMRDASIKQQLADAGQIMPNTTA